MKIITEDAAEKAAKRKIIDAEIERFVQRGGEIKRIPHLTASERIEIAKGNMKYFNRHPENKKPPIDVDKLVGGVG